MKAPRASLLAQNADIDGEDTNRAAMSQKKVRMGYEK
jgi:hypothetical protein